MPAVDREAFRAAYRRSVADVLPYVTRERQAVIARHNLGLHPDRYSVEVYLERSELRYLRVVDELNRRHPGSGQPIRTLDVGGFLGAFPLALARAGARATLAEEYGYYYGAFDELRDYLEREGVEVWAADFTQPLSGAPTHQYDLVTNMAMLEHLPSSPRQLMDNLRACLAAEGTLVLEVPNIAYWPNRLRALRGESLHQAFDLYYASEPPFMGHHREYTVQELRELLAWSGFAVCSLQTFNYSLTLRAGRWRDRVYALVVWLWPTWLWTACREVIMVSARAAAGPSGQPAALSLRPAS